jgi:hypothetical protein
MPSSITLVSAKCGVPSTFLFCFPSGGIKPTPIPSPAAPLAVNTYSSVQAGITLISVPFADGVKVGDKIVVLYQGGNVDAVDKDGKVVYMFDPVGDLNKDVSFLWNGVAWVLA